MTADIEELKRFLYSGTITQYGKRELIKYYEKQIKEQEQVIDKMAGKILLTGGIEEFRNKPTNRDDVKQYFINKVKEKKTNER